MEAFEFEYAPFRYGKFVGQLVDQQEKILLTKPPARVIINFLKMLPSGFSNLHGCS